jgi:two-component system cell cycle response regulator DivK
MSILIIEDDLGSQKLYCAHFQNSPSIKSLNTSFIIAATGVDGLNQAQQTLPSLILMDVKLPDIDGIEVIKLLKQNPKTSHIPIIAVTALAFFEDEMKILAAGADAYLSKPYSLKELECFVRKNILLEK